MEYLVYDSKVKKLTQEKVYGEKWIKILYPQGADSIWVRFLRKAVGKWPFFSSTYGWFQKLSFSKAKIKPFIEKYQVDASEFLCPIDEFKSFNDFFTRKLTKNARPIDFNPESLINPADGRYLVYPDFEISKFIDIKGEKLDLKVLNVDISELTTNMSSYLAELKSLNNFEKIKQPKNKKRQLHLRVNIGSNINRQISELEKLK
jgi:phosphatidylserine decarboxylase